MIITSNYRGISIDWEEQDNEEMQRLTTLLIVLLKILAATSYRTYEEEK